MREGSCVSARRFWAWACWSGQPVPCGRKFSLGRVLIARPVSADDIVDFPSALPRRRFAAPVNAIVIQSRLDAFNRPPKSQRSFRQGRRRPCFSDPTQNSASRLTVDRSRAGIPSHASPVQSRAGNTRKEILCLTRQNQPRRSRSTRSRQQSGATKKTAASLTLRPSSAATKTLMITGGAPALSTSVISSSWRRSPIWPIRRFRSSEPPIASPKTPTSRHRGCRRPGFSLRSAVCTIGIPQEVLHRSGHKKWKRQPSSSLGLTLGSVDTNDQETSTFRVSSFKRSLHRKTKRDSTTTQRPSAALRSQTLHRLEAMQPFASCSPPKKQPNNAAYILRGGFSAQCAPFLTPAAQIPRHAERNAFCVVRPIVSRADYSAYETQRRLAGRDVFRFSLRMIRTSTPGSKLCACSRRATPCDFLGLRPGAWLNLQRGTPSPVWIPLCAVFASTRKPCPFPHLRLRSACDRQR